MTEEWHGITLWYSPYKIRYRRLEVIWILNHIRQLRIGDWPPDPDRSSSYTDAHLAKNRGEYKAYVENVVSILGMVERRLLKTGMDGAMAYLVYAGGLGYGEVGKMFHLSSEQVIERVDNAISYCEGKKDKPMSYEDYKFGRARLHITGEHRLCQ